MGNHSSLLEGRNRKVLVSPGFGAGWATWIGDGKFAAEYQPIIDFLESGGEFVEKPYSSRDREAPCYDQFEEPGRSVLQQFVHDYNKTHDAEPDDYVCLLGAEDLIVREVSGPYRIDEYDGAESVVEASGETWW